MKYGNSSHHDEHTMTRAEYERVRNCWAFVFVVRAVVGEKIPDHVETFPTPAAAVDTFYYGCKLVKVNEKRVIIQVVKPDG